MGKRVERGFFLEGANYLRLDWGKLSFFSILFFTILFIDSLFVSYFLFNYFFETGIAQQYDTCLYDSYISFLKDPDYVISEDLCDGFFTDYMNYGECDSLDSLSDYCRFVFISEYGMHYSCPEIEDVTLRRDCENTMSVIPVDSAVYDLNFFEEEQPQ